MLIDVFFCTLILFSVNCDCVVIIFKQLGCSLILLFFYRQSFALLFHLRRKKTPKLIRSWLYVVVSNLSDFMVTHYVVLRRSPTPSTASNAHIDDVSSSEPPTPTASPRKEGNGGKSLTKKQQRELAPCKTLLEQLEQQEEAWPFLLPVNTKQFPTYKKIIKTPMDLSTIKKKLQDSV